MRNIKMLSALHKIEVIDGKMFYFHTHISPTTS